MEPILFESKSNSDHRGKVSFTNDLNLNKVVRTYKVINKQVRTVRAWHGHKIEEKWIKYLTEKGYISVNGASITIGKVSKNTFYVHLIPETLKTTNLDELIYDNYVNLEFDQATIAIVDTTERLINQKR